ncbi:MAG: nicotinate phosphoribosyltransferase [Patescibacteria group bacterium]|jgi:nicotinate phosphoribosyltransferase
MFNEFITQEELSLFTSGGFIATGGMMVSEGMQNLWGTHDIFVREMPACRNYLVFAGLEPVVDYLLNLKFDQAQLEYLKKGYNFSDEVMEYYRNFRFTGDLYAMPEGSLFFPYQPVMRICAPLIEAQIIERYVLNAVMAYSVLTTKMSRFVHSVKPGITTGVNFIRAHGPQASAIALRAAKSVGVDLAAMPIFGLRNNLEVEKGAVTHSFISSFATEEQALRVFSKYCRGRGLWLLDTYDSMKGLAIFIKVAKELKKQKKPFPNMIQFDSGDLVKQSKIARKKLDQAGLKEVKIILISNLDEYKITKMYKQGMIADVVVGGEELTTSPDAPKLGFVSKLSEMIDGSAVIPKMKLSEGKLSYPGKKQVFRQTKDGKYFRDIVGLDEEKISGKKLLMPIIKKGKLVCKLPALQKINQHYQAECKKFSPALFAVNQRVKYSSEISPALKSLAQKTKLAIAKAHYEL